MIILICMPFARKAYFSLRTNYLFGSWGDHKTGTHNYGKNNPSNFDFFLCLLFVSITIIRDQPLLGIFYTCIGSLTLSCPKGFDASDKLTLYNDNFKLFCYLHFQQCYICLANYKSQEVSHSKMTLLVHTIK